MFSIKIFNAAQPGVGRVQVLGSKKVHRQKGFCWLSSVFRLAISKKVKLGYPDRGYPEGGYPDREYPDRGYPDGGTQTRGNQTGGT